MTSLARSRHDGVVAAMPARRRKRRALLMTGVLFVVYFGYIALLLLAPQALRTPVGASFSLGLALGVAAIVILWLLVVLARGDEGPVRP